MKYEILEKHTGTNPARTQTNGKYACGELNAHTNYGTPNYTAAKRSTRRTIKQALKDYEDEDC